MRKEKKYKIKLGPLFTTLTILASGSNIRSNTIFKKDMDNK